MEARHVSTLCDARPRDQQRPSTDRRDQLPGAVDASQEGKHFVVLRENCWALRATGNQYAGIVERICLADRSIDVEHADTRKIRIDLDRLRIEGDDLGLRTRPLELVLRQEVFRVLKRIRQQHADLHDSSLTPARFRVPIPMCRDAARAPPAPTSKPVSVAVVDRGFTPLYLAAVINPSRSA